MNDIEIFGKLLRLKSDFQRINQLSWSVQKYHEQFERLDKLTPKERVSMVEGYSRFFRELEQTYKEIKKEID